MPLAERRGPPEAGVSDEARALAPAPVGPPASAASPPKRLSGLTKPLVWLYRSVFGESRQADEWSNRIEAIEQANAIDAEPSTEGKALLADRATYRQVKATGLVAAMGGMSIGALWMSWLIPLYAYGWGFGAWAYLYLLPVPFAWRVGRRMWERAALQGMKELGPQPSPQQQLRTLSSGMIRAMGAGAGMGFALVFSQALISWFMTPAPTLLQELLIDLVHGTGGAAVGAAVGAIFGPLVGRGAPNALTAPTPNALLGAPESE